MLKTIINLLLSHGVTLVAPIPLSACTLLRPDKLTRAGFASFDGLTAIMLAVPYLTVQPHRNISAYAVPPDYHLYFEELFAALTPMLEEAFPDHRFRGFADNSPIKEREAAAAAGLGILGDNGMLITKQHSSYVFLGEIITDLPLPEAKALPMIRCESCGACRNACPKEQTGICLSELTQKKGALTAEEESTIRTYGSAWGCDRCQETCPHTKRALTAGTLYTSIPFFMESLLPTLTASDIEAMPQEEFSRRAYAWRKKETILRNLNILEESNQKEIL